VNQRTHFRLEYPKPDRPTILIDGRTYEILDLSESGCKFAVDGVFSSAKPSIRGTVKFKDGKTCDVVGHILRSTDEFCVMILNKGIPLAKMHEEQIALIRKYKNMERK
jgi:hypothetical protein